ncbi:MAG: hypothetical protein ACI9R3_003913 [Verrucomicrobiales bacterium]|jgi:hypothetical protein
MRVRQGWLSEPSGWERVHVTSDCRHPQRVQSRNVNVRAEQLLG